MVGTAASWREREAGEGGGDIHSAAGYILRGGPPRALLEWWLTNNLQSKSGYLRDECMGSAHDGVTVQYGIRVAREVGKKSVFADFF